MSDSQTCKPNRESLALLSLVEFALVPCFPFALHRCPGEPYPYAGTCFVVSTNNRYVNNSAGPLFVSSRVIVLSSDCSVCAGLGGGGARFVRSSRIAVILSLVLATAWSTCRRSSRSATSSKRIGSFSCRRTRSTPSKQSHLVRIVAHLFLMNECLTID